MIIKNQGFLFGWSYSFKDTHEKNDLKNKGSKETDLGRFLNTSKHALKYVDKAKLTNSKGRTLQFQKLISQEQYKTSFSSCFKLLGKKK